MLRSILPIWRSKSILMRALAGVEACCAVAVADFLQSGDAETSGNAAAPSAAATPSFRKLRLAGSLIVIAVSPFSPRTVYQYSDDKSHAWPKPWRPGGTSIYGETFTRQQGILVGMICGNQECTKMERGKRG